MPDVIRSHPLGQLRPIAAVPPKWVGNDVVQRGLDQRAIPPGAGISMLGTAVPERLLQVGARGSGEASFAGSRLHALGINLSLDLIEKGADIADGLAFAALIRLDGDLNRPPKPLELHLLLLFMTLEQAQARPDDLACVGITPARDLGLDQLIEALRETDVPSRHVFFASFD
jgi:hypothetical protein